MVERKKFFLTEGITQSDRSIYTPGNFAKQNLLYLQEVGRLQSLKPHVCIRENLSSFLIMIVLEGSGNLTINNKSIRIQKGNIAFINCKEKYEHISDEKDAWKLAWVHFNGNIAENYYDLFMKYTENNNVFITEQVQTWDEIIGKLLLIQNDNSINSDLKCGELLLQLLNRVIISVIETEQSNAIKDEAILDDVRIYLNEKFCDANLCSLLEGRYNESIDMLNDRFLKRFGINIEEYVNNRRLNIAKEMLRFSIKPLEEIAKETGFETGVCMQQAFFATEHMTPEAYRMKWSQWVR